MKSKIPDWENPAVIHRNKEEGHALAFAYTGRASALAFDPPPSRLSLNGPWRFLWLFGKPVPEGCVKAEYDDSGWDCIQVPGVWQLPGKGSAGYGSPYYYSSSYPQAVDARRVPRISRALQETGVYRRAFALPENFSGGEIYLHFGAAKAALEVYVNGQCAGFSKGAMTPHEFNVTRFLRPGENRIAAVVWRYSDGTYLEDQDMWFFSGIYRDVFLYAEPKISVRDFYMRAGFRPDFPCAGSGSAGSIDAYARLTLHMRNSAEPSPPSESSSPSEPSPPSEAGAVTVRASIQELGISLGEKELAIGEGDFAVEFEAPVPSPRLWSHEQPNLYTVLIEWEYGGKTFFKAFRFGFKKIEIRGNVLYLNGKRLILRGVNRHDFDPGTGWTLTPERYHEDLRLLKRLNVNAIRTSHYPNDPLLYSLCDEYGILVMDEADIETHGVRRKIPANSPVWTAACVDRMRRMVLRDRNHACVVFWSLGNESGRGGAFAAMRKAAGALDDTRPFHYEGEHNKTSSDVISRMYPDEKTFKKLCAKKALKTAANPVMAYAMYDKPVPAKLYETMPVLLCEFAHCMGNSLGNFSEYTAAFEKYPHMCGGFIWDFADQAIRREDGNGRCQWLHGDDFLEVYSQEGYKGKSRTGGDGCFCGNGIVSADRKPHPAALEVKKCYQTLRVMAVEGRENRYRIFNNQMFSGLENYALVWQFACGGVVFEEGEVPSGLLASIGPGQSAEIDVEPSLERPASGDITLTFSWRHKKAGIRACAPAFCEDGYEQAFDQFALRRNRPVAAGSLSCNKNAAGNFTCRFERGVLASVKMNAANGSGDRELLAAAVQPNLYRALTDNDIGVANFARFLRPFVTGGRWERAAEKQRVRRWNIYAEEGGSWKKRGRVPEDGKTYRVSAEWKHPLCRSLATDYTVYPDGKILLEMRVRSKRIGLVRAGVQLALGEEFGEVEWYGRGPHECYPDRKSGARLGRYQCPVEELGHGYLRPQENGARCDVSWIEIKSRSGVKIRVQDPSGAGFLFSAWPYSQKALERATHIHTLQREALTTLSLDSAMCGVGGDLPGIASLHEAYRLKAGKTYTARFLLEFEACNPNG